MYRIHLTLPSQSNQHIQHTKELKTNKETKTSSTQEASNYIKHDWYYTPINRIPPITLFWGRKKKKFVFISPCFPLSRLRGWRHMTKFAQFCIVSVWNHQKPQESLQKRHLCSTSSGLHWLVPSLWSCRSLSQPQPMSWNPAAPLKLSPDLSKTWIRLINPRQVLSWWWIKVQWMFSTPGICY